MSDANEYAQTLSSLGVGVCRTAPDGTFLTVNDVFLRVLGAASLEELVDRRAPSLYSEPGRREHLMRMLAAGEVVPVDELEVRRLDGSHVRVRLRTRAHFDDDGALVHIDTLLEETAPLEAADEHLRRSHVLLDAVTQMQNRFIAGMSPDAMFRGLLDELLAFTGAAEGLVAQVVEDDEPFLRTLADTGGVKWAQDRREAVNADGSRVRELYGLDSPCGRVITSGSPLLSNDPAADGIVPAGADGDDVTCFLGVPIRGGERTLGMIALANRDGGFEDWMLDYLAPLTATMGSILESVAVDRELSETLRREQALQEWLRSVLELAADAIVAFDDRLRIIAVNPAAGRLIGRAPDEVVGASIGGFLPPDRKREYAARVLQALDGGHPIEASVVRANGQERAVEVTVVRTAFDELPTTTLIVRDIAERKAFEQALLNARSAAERAARAKDEILAGMSHELRTPLNSIIGLSAILRRQVYGPLGDKQASYVERIESSGRYLLAIIGDILDLAKMEADKEEADTDVLEAGGLVAAAEEVVRELAREKGLTLRVDVPAGLPPIVADERRGTQLLLNLLSNAIKFTDAGGTVTVTARRQGRVVAIDVVDDGIGIPADQLERIFEPFEQVNSSLSRTSEGTGLGLALSRRLAKLQNATLTVRSTPCKGSTFTAAFPAVDG